MPEPPRTLLRRRDVPGTARFLTFSCYRRLRLFDIDRIKDRFVEVLTERLTAERLECIAWVVMPEHVHLIVHTEVEAAVTRFLQTLKDRFAREVLARWRKLDAAILPRLKTRTGKTHFWQPGGGHDRNVLGDELIEKIRYLHKNPITRGLSADSVSWKWSSAATYRELPTAIGPPLAFDLIPNHKNDLT